MNDFEHLTGHWLAQARSAFRELESADALLRPEKSCAPRAAASALYAAARTGTTDSALEAVMADNAAARAFYRRALAESSSFALPEARAASAGAMSSRHGDGCSIRIERSRAEPDQYFVVVELAQGRSAALPPTSLVVCDRQDRCRRFPLPSVRNGIAQIIAEADSDLLRMIGDPASRVYLL